CRDLTGDYVVRLGNFAALVVDSAKVIDTAGEDSNQVPIIRQQLIDVLPKIPAYAWLVTHKPVNGMLAKPGDRNMNIVSNRVLQAGGRAAQAPGGGARVAGH